MKGKTHLRTDDDKALIRNALISARETIIWFVAREHGKRVDEINEHLSADPDARMPAIVLIDAALAQMDMERK